MRNILNTVKSVLANAVGYVPVAPKPHSMEAKADAACGARPVAVPAATVGLRTWQVVDGTLPAADKTVTVVLQVNKEGGGKGRDRKRISADKAKGTKICCFGGEINERLRFASAIAVAARGDWAEAKADHQGDLYGVALNAKAVNNTVVSAKVNFQITEAIFEQLESQLESLPSDQTVQLVCRVVLTGGCKKVADHPSPLLQRGEASITERTDADGVKRVDILAKANLYQWQLVTVGHPLWVSFSTTHEVENGVGRVNQLPKQVAEVVNQLVYSDHTNWVQSLTAAAPASSLYGAMQNAAGITPEPVVTAEAKADAASSSLLREQLAAARAELEADAEDDGESFAA
jgi:hypothetical protein